MNFSKAYDDSCSAVGLAVRKGDIKMLQTLLSEGADFCVRDNRGWFPIHEAAFHGHTDCVHELIKAAYDNGYDPLQIWPSPYDINDRNALVLAARNGHLETMKILANLYSFDSEDFYYAVEASINYPNLFSFLLSKYTGDINRKNKWDCTILHTAVCSSPIESIKMILAHNINLEAKDINGRSALHCVCGENRKDALVVVKLLVKNGSNINSCDDEGCSVLFIAAQNNSISIVRYLLEQNADPYQGFPVEIDSSAGIAYAVPICIAAEKGYTTILKLLIKHMDKNVLLQKKILSPVISAISGLHTDCLRVLLHNEYDLTCPANSILCYFPLAHLCQPNLTMQQNVLQMFVFLLKKGANVTPLSKRIFFQEVLSTSNPEVVFLFCKFGAFECYFTHPNVLSQIQIFFVNFLNFHCHNFSDLIIKNFCVLLGWMPLLKFSYCIHTKSISNVSKIVPSLSSICRYYIRFMIVSKFGSALNINLLPLPGTLKQYLWCEELEPHEIE